MVTSAAEHGIAEWHIRLTSRRKSGVLRQYIRPVEKRQHSPTNDRPGRPRRRLAVPAS